MRRTIQLNAVSVIGTIGLLCATCLLAQFIARHRSNLTLPSDDTKCVRVDGDHVWVNGRGFGLLRARTLACLWRQGGLASSHRAVLGGLASDFINFVRACGNVGWICTDDGLSSFDGTTWATYRKAGAGGELRISSGSQGIEKQRLPQSLAHNYTLGVDFQGDDVWVATAQGVSRGSPSSRSRCELMTKKMPPSDGRGLFQSGGPLADGGGNPLSSAHE